MAIPASTATLRIEQCNPLGYRLTHIVEVRGIALYYTTDYYHRVGMLEHSEVLLATYIERGTISKFHRTRHVHYIDILLFDTMFEQSVNGSLCECVCDFAIPIRYYNSIALT